MLSKKHSKIILILLGIVFSTEIFAQDSISAENSTRFFMPSLQMGYINHNSEVISEGLIIQTSLEYRAKNNLLFRLNYDDFSGRISISDSNNNSYIGKVPLSELIGGIGYRFQSKQHNLFFLVQSGLRFYELPAIQTINGKTSINQSGKQIAPIRYTIGYEYEILKNVFLNMETFLGHFIEEKDYWSNNKPFWGTTVGLSTTLF